MPYSVDLREKVVAALKREMTQTSAAQVFNVARRTVYSCLSIEKQTGPFERTTGFQKGHSHGITDIDKCRKLIDEQE